MCMLHEHLNRCMESSEGPTGLACGKGDQTNFGILFDASSTGVQTLLQKNIVCAAVACGNMQCHVTPKLVGES